MLLSLSTLTLMILPVVSKGIKPSDAGSKIKKAYRKAALRHHPDKDGQFLARSESGDDGQLWKEIAELNTSYFGSSGVSGATPSTFAVLRNLQTVWASDNELIGSIPEFIGNWRFQGNSFGGPIPTTFSNLTLMEDLRRSDLSNGSSSLAFLKDMKSLNLLSAPIYFNLKFC
ncbi:putative LRR receptor-like serine/threonine-protein kinase [Camellia lanceoleosa]|uniref:LRR receptor-like serine/threonine-protein kinase n=1 Tax=Camellia lanceoleosa TaxID=1840588 RepID=A0ACC0J3S5_9ERIC|nr:putative LRR receptor-like serine/threonine-protein kinase [Camellia lanceoleosa]